MHQQQLILHKRQPAEAIVSAQFLAQTEASNRY